MPTSNYSPSALSAFINSGRVDLPLSGRRALDAIATLEGAHDWSAIAGKTGSALLKARANAMRAHINENLVDGKLPDEEAALAIVSALAAKPEMPAYKTYSDNVLLCDIVSPRYRSAGSTVTQSEAIKTARNRFGDIPIAHAMLAWNDETAQACIIPHPDEKDWADRLGLQSTAGACCGYWDDLPKRSRQLAMFTEAMQLVIDGHLLFPVLHEALLVIPEYRELMGPNAPYPPLCPKHLRV